MSDEIKQDTNLDLFSRIQTNEAIETAAPVSEPPVAFIQKCLHPPSAIAGFEGLPTNDTRSQVLTEWRTTRINQPFIVSDNKTIPSNIQILPADLQQISIAYLQTSGARVNSIAFINNPYASNAMVQDLGNVNIVDSYDFKNFRHDASKYRPAYKSGTYYLNATAFNDTGMVTGVQFNPNILFFGDLMQMSQNNPGLFYDFVASLIKSGDIKSDDQPTHAARAKWEMFPKYHRDEIIRRCNVTANSILTLDPFIQAQIALLGSDPVTYKTPDGTWNLVPTASQIAALGLRSLTTKAKEGMFSVQRLNTIAPSWLTGGKPSDPTSPATISNSGLYGCYFAVPAADSTSSGYSVIPLRENTIAGPAYPFADVLHDTLWSADQTWSWIRFDGLALNSTVTSNVQTQLIATKYYSGFEIQPQVASAWSGMIKLAPKPDIGAMQALMDAFFELKDVFPASFNFAGIGAVAAPLIASAGKEMGAGILKKALSPFAKVFTPGAKEHNTEPIEGRPAKSKKGWPYGQSAPRTNFTERPRVYRPRSLSRQMSSMRISNRPRSQSRGRNNRNRSASNSRHRSSSRNTRYYRNPQKRPNKKNKVTINTRAKSH